MEAAAQLAQLADQGQAARLPVFGLVVPRSSVEHLTLFAKGN